MGVHNVHERLLTASASEVGELLDSLSGPDDRLWPGESWSPMRFDRPLAPGARGGHEPVGYTVEAYVPSVWIRFAFDAPRGFLGFHEFAVLPVDEERTLLRHTLSMNTEGPARLSWPLLFRPLHDACLEDSLDRAQLACSGRLDRPARHSPYVRMLLTLFRLTTRRGR